MSTSQADGRWEGSLKDGKGVMKPANGSEVPFSLGTRFEGAKGSNPEEMIGAALAGCFSMALSAELGKAGLTPTRIATHAAVKLDKVGDGFEVTQIALTCEATVPGADAAKLEQIAQATKNACPISKALGGVKEITLKATLTG